MERIDLSKSVRLGYFAHFDADEAKRIGSYRHLVVYQTIFDKEYRDDHLQIKVVDFGNTNRKGHPKLVMEIDASTLYEKNAFHIDITRIDSVYQGWGIAPKIYRLIMKRLGVILQAGSMQSAGGRAVWAALAKMPDINMFAKTPRGKVLHDIEVDDSNEIFSETMKIYNCSSRAQVFAKAA